MTEEWDDDDELLTELPHFFLCLHFYVVVIVVEMVNKLEKKSRIQAIYNWFMVR